MASLTEIYELILDVAIQTLEGKKHLTELLEQYKLLKRELNERIMMMSHDADVRPAAIKKGTPPPPSTPAPDSPPPGWNPELVAAIVRDLTSPIVEDTPVIVEPTATINGGDHHAIPMEHHSTLGIRNISLATPTLANAVLLILVNLPIVLFAAMHLLLVKSAGIAQFPFDPGGRR